MNRSAEIMRSLVAGYSVLSQWVSQHRCILGLTLSAIAISYAVERARYALFGSRISWEITLVFAPVHEDALKLGLVFYFLAMATLVTGALGPAHRQGATRATRALLVISPMIAGGVLALFEPPSLNRLLGHTASVGLGFGGCLFAWRRSKTLSGFFVGLAIATSVHSFLNTAYYWPLLPTGRYQFAAALALLTTGVWILSRAARQEPASDIATELFPWRLGSAYGFGPRPDT